MAELDDAYANSAHIPGAEAYPPRWQADAAAFRADATMAELAYGAGEREAIDLFLPEETARGCLIFVHGGYWRSTHRYFWSHFAAGGLGRGWAVAMPSYDLCPQVRISDITRQIAAAVEVIAARVEGPIALAGHSAGGHLVARMLAPGMLSDAVAQRIVACVPISPLADLEPLLKTSMNDDFQMDVTAARAESPIYQPAPVLPVRVLVGAEERPVFLDQARLLSRTWDCELILDPGRHHFDVIEFMKAPEHPLLGFLTQSSGS